MKLRRLTALLLLLAALLCLCACGTDDPICGRWRCTGAQGEDHALEAWQLEGEPVLLSLYSDGRGSLSRSGQEGSLSWTRTGDALDLKIGGVVLSAEIRDDCILLEAEPGLFLRFERDEELPENPEPPVYETWTWFGWWSVEASADKLPETWMDCCASLEDGDFGPVLRIWDEKSSRGEPLGLVYLRWDGSEAVSESGWFLQAEIGEGDWRLEPEGILDLKGSGGAEGEEFSFRICLRPWGDRWENTGEHPPLHLRDWYLPLIDAGEAMPDQMD